MTSPSKHLCVDNLQESGTIKQLYCDRFPERELDGTHISLQDSQGTDNDNKLGMQGKLPIYKVCVHQSMGEQSGLKKLLCHGYIKTGDHLTFHLGF
jgi:hypothetical protein